MLAPACDRQEQASAMHGNAFPQDVASRSGEANDLSPKHLNIFVCSYYIILSNMIAISYIILLYYHHFLVLRLAC